MNRYYPTDDELDKISNWHGTARELIEYIQGLWEYTPPDLRPGRDSSTHKKIYRLTIHTWGWSGNEDIIDALQGTMFWIVFWANSRRGGHYEFEISPTMIDKDKLWANPVSQARRRI